MHMRTHRGQFRQIYRNTLFQSQTTFRPSSETKYNSTSFWEKNFRLKLLKFFPGHLKCSFDIQAHLFPKSEKFSLKIRIKVYTQLVSRKKTAPKISSGRLKRNFQNRAKNCCQMSKNIPPKLTKQIQVYNIFKTNSTKCTSGHAECRLANLLTLCRQKRQICCSGSGVKIKLRNFHRSDSFCSIS